MQKVVEVIDYTIDKPKIVESRADGTTIIRLNPQGELFPLEERQELQQIIVDNYRERVLKSANVVVEDAEDEFQVIETVKTLGTAQENIFDVEQVQKANDEIKRIEHDKAVKEAQKHMNLPYFEHPKGDNQVLLNYQHDYIKYGDTAAWGKLLELAFEVTKRLIWAWLKEHRDVYLDEIGQDEKASIAMEYVLRRYSKNVGWYVDKNFIGALKGGVMHAMSYTSKIEEMTVVVEDVHLERNKHQIN